MKMELLTEDLNSTESGLITESIQNGANVFLSGIFMQAGIKNRNGRVYSLSEMSSEMANANKKIQETNGIMGELDHPNNLSINLANVSHVITELGMNGNNVMGKAKLLETPMGKIAKELINSGVALGVSSRGAGNVTESGDVNGFNFLTVDIVATPSCASAVPKTVFEALDMSRNGKAVLTLSEQVKDDLAAQKYFKDAIMKFLNEGMLAKK